MKLIFKGTVQGVGFRPTIFRIAKEMGLNGYVLNKGSEVEVIIDKDADKFIKELKKNLPSIAKITDVEIKEDNRVFKGFNILHSKKGEKKSLIPYDTAICDECRSELFDKNNRRYHYPFTNCTVCGARFSLIENVPYDRERTSMKDFPLCTKCNKEYENPENRRYHAQIISCKLCGPKYELYNHKKQKIETKDIIKYFAKEIDNGKFCVIKSWGGMHICCNLDQIDRFRKWYGRPQKSFAIMVKDIKSAEEYADINDYERTLLLSNAKPVVLLEKKKAEEISPGLNTIGVFLPYTGLHHILFSFLKTDALVMTSANIPGEPMIIENKDVFSLNAEIYLLHNRKIPNRVDDTVLRVWNKKRFFLRKSRGFIPDPISIPYSNHIVCVGAGENVTGTLSCDKQLFSTQYIGNSSFYPTIEFLDKSIRHLMSLNMDDKTIDAVGTDLHPLYNTHTYAKQISEEFSAPLFTIQHHWAHAASLLLDNNAHEGVILTLDGLGYGDDGTLWGGEVIFSDFNCFKRIGHLEYIHMLGGDQATKNPKRLVYAIFKSFGKEIYFSGKDSEIFNKMMKNAPVTSSIGRILDALACYLEICQIRTYDGETAMKLEKYLKIGRPLYSFESEIKNNVVPTIDLFRQLDEIVKGPLSEQKKGDISHSFVKKIIDDLSEIAIEYAIDNHIKCIGLTGGVSYNIPITEMVSKKVSESGLKFIVHNNIPNGDGGISYGQNCLIGNKLK